MRLRCRFGPRAERESRFSALRQGFRMTPEVGSTAGIREQRPRVFQVRLPYENLTCPSRREILERRIDRFRVAVATFDACRPEQTANHFGFGLSRYHCYYDCAA